MDAPVVDDRSEEARSFDESSLGAGAPEDYSLNGLWLGRDALDAHGYLDPAAQQIDGAVRTAMSALSVPKAVGLGFAEAMVDSSTATEELADMSEPEQQTWHIQQRVDFARVAKVGWEEATAQMRPWLARLPAETRNFLSAAGAFNSVTAMVRLWSTFKLVEARAGMKGTKS